MTKRTARALALVLSATPLLLIGCGDSGNNNGTGGSSGGGFGGAIKDEGGGGGAGGAKDDVGVLDSIPPALETPRGLHTAPVNPDIALPRDTPVVDAGIPDLAISADLPIQLGTAKIDT